MTNNVRETISLLEAFPDAGGKPIFDHFGVIVPGISFPTTKIVNITTLYSFLDERGIVQSYSTREEAIKSLDLILIKNEYFHGVLVGEKDGKCFFISYFI